MVNSLSARYIKIYKKEKFQEKANKRYQNLSEEIKEKTSSMVANNIKIFLKIKSKGCLFTIVKILKKTCTIKDWFYINSDSQIMGQNTVGQSNCRIL